MVWSACTRDGRGHGLEVEAMEGVHEPVQPGTDPVRLHMGTSCGDGPLLDALLAAQLVGRDVPDGGDAAGDHVEDRLLPGTVELGHVVLRQEGGTPVPEIAGVGVEAVTTDGRVGARTGDGPPHGGHVARHVGLAPPRLRGDVLGHEQATRIKFAPPHVGTVQVHQLEPVQLYARPFQDVGLEGDGDDAVGLCSEGLGGSSLA